MIKASLLTVCICFVIMNVFADENIMIASPDGNVEVRFSILDGQSIYSVYAGKQQVIGNSSMGFQFNKQEALKNNLMIKDHQVIRFSNTWQRPWGQTKVVRNHYKQLTVDLIETTKLKRELTIIFRVYDDGIGFRYYFPQQENLAAFEILSEETEFALIGNPSSWWIPQDFVSYEAVYRNTPLSNVKAVNTPITLQTEQGLFLSLHEAALTDYAGMTLVKKAGTQSTLVSALVPWPDGVKVKGKPAFKTPWRTIQIAKSAGDLITSDLIENLNEPSVIQDTSWITPMKYIGIWWGMHTRKYTWEAGPKHGATTRNTKQYIDFASNNNIQAVLVEGWNKGWETWHTGLNEQDFTAPYDDFDLDAIVQYGKQKNVALMGHHETGGNVPAYELQLEKAFELYARLGVTSVKTGYAGKMHPEGVYHHGQQMVNHYRRVVTLAAQHKIMLNVHEPIKPTGIRRTYPNMMTREGGRGMEWNGWSVGNSPEHTVTLPFTRLLAGPMDYTPGIFNLQFDPQEQYRVHTTLARQLAHYVTLYSPIQMAADMIENYQSQPAFEFVRKVPADWDDIRVLEAKIGDYLAVARRYGKKWFLGSATDEQPRRLDLSLGFLDANRHYKATIYADGPDNDFVDNPASVEISSFGVRKHDHLPAVMASGGGLAAIIQPVSAKEFSKLKPLQHYQQQLDKRLSRFQTGHRYGEIQAVDHFARNKHITLLTDFDSAYTGGGNAALVDGLKGGPDYTSLWQGYRKQDLHAVIDLGDEQEISRIEIDFMQSLLHSILLPVSVIFEVSVDGNTYENVGNVHYSTKQGIPDYQRKKFSVAFSVRKARFIKVRAVNPKSLPAWHIRPGQTAFIFADEIQIF